MSVRQFALGDRQRLCNCPGGQCLDDPLSAAYFDGVGSHLYPHWTIVPRCSLTSEAHE
jgi:hypothetical protein